MGLIQEFNKKYLSCKDNDPTDASLGKLVYNCISCSLLSAMTLNSLTGHHNGHPRHSKSFAHDSGNQAPTTPSIKKHVLRQPT
jgi:hypothetical protein